MRWLALLGCTVGVVGLILWLATGVVVLVVIGVVLVLAAVPGLPLTGYPPWHPIRNRKNWF